jgi:histidinol-phosphate aminotransferase
MGKIDLESLVRKNILNLHPYSSARDEFQGEAPVLLDANENPFNSPYNRYPDPHQRKLKSLISKKFNIPEGSVFLGNGSDEAIDLLVRAFCEPGKNNIVSMHPSYGMYEVCAGINDVEFRKVSLKADLSLDTEAMLKATDEMTRIIFLCSPNNPTANLIHNEDIMKLVNGFHGLVIVDEAYIDFSGSKGMLNEIFNSKNLVVLRTFSKAWGMAGIRLGMAIADPLIISLLDKIKYPYNLSCLTQELMVKRLSEEGSEREWIRLILDERAKLVEELSALHIVKKVFPSDANFLLLRFEEPFRIYEILRKNGIIVRDRSKVHLCDGCLRITVGTPEENTLLLKILQGEESNTVNYN